MSSYNPSLHESNSGQPPSAVSVKSDDECPACKFGPPQNWDSSSSSGRSVVRKKHVKKVDYKHAKLILQRSSSHTGENLFDHLVEIIKRIIDERPINVVDYFEQFSRDVRSNKFTYCSEDPCNEPQFLEMADQFFISLAPPSDIKKVCYEEEECREESQLTLYDESIISIEKPPHALKPNENILQIMHFWSLCGLGFSIDEMFHLSWSIQRVQAEPNVKNARFWGKIYGLHGSYYIVEAILTKGETDNRSSRMKQHLLDKMEDFIRRRDNNIGRKEEDSSLVPGTMWLEYPPESLDKMQPKVKSIPVLKIKEQFDTPSETFGTGLNQRSYFVTTSLSERWQELPIVTPKQVQVSKQIKKFFTGNLEAALDCFPLFPGTEKHYLRATIARISAGTYIAPKDFYRRMTKKELRSSSEDLLDTEVESDDEYESENGESALDYDTQLTNDELYMPPALRELTYPGAWVHVRSHILNQGRVHYIDTEQILQDFEKKLYARNMFEFEMEEEGELDPVIKDLERKALLKKHGYEFEMEEESELINELTDDTKQPETGPELLRPCNEDINQELVVPWTARYSSLYNENNQMMIMRSNLWPGAYTLAFENFCDSIYVGWGMKYVARCTSLENIPIIEDIDFPDIAIEALDPTPEMERKWRNYNMRHDTWIMDEMSDISVDYDDDDEDARR